MPRRGEITRRQLLPAGLAAVAASCSRAKSRPNILFVMTDDHATGRLGCYGDALVRTPNLDRLAAEGARFTNSFVTNSLCAPGRATVLTGAYSHIHGVRGNSEAKDAVETIDAAMATYPELLRAAGYRTGLVGKWHLSHEPAGFDTWRILPGQGLYFDPEFIENGQRRKIRGYATDITTDMALDFLGEKSDKPFCLVYQHKAPHRPFQPAARHARLYEGIELPYPSTFDDDYATRRVAREAEDMRFDVSLAPDYPELPRNLTPAERKKWIYQRFAKDYYGAIAGVDENLGRVLDRLEDDKRLDDTVILYTSDNGFFVGEHGWYDKRFMYEPSLRVPLIVRAPGVRRGSVPAAMALNIDIAPTILDYAGVEPPASMQGRSLRPVLEGAEPDDWRKSVYYAYYENSWVLAGKGKEAMSDPTFQYFTPHRIGPHRGVRTATYKLIHYYAEGDYWELFDLGSDPDELRNLHGAPGTEKITADLKRELEQLRRQFRDVG
ncbi:MAG: sulfatase [Bryobacteraceae bacterium]|nr:sulfatase [Bryobacteraceae bacterium]